MVGWEKCDPGGSSGSAINGSWNRMAQCKSAEIVQRFIHGRSETEITKLDG